jgi:hypothetical protein
VCYNSRAVSWLGWDFIYVLLQLNIVQILNVCLNLNGHHILDLKSSPREILMNQSLKYTLCKLFIFSSDIWSWFRTGGVGVGSSASSHIVLFFVNMFMHHLYFANSENLNRHHALDLLLKFKKIKKYAFFICMAGWSGLKWSNLPYLFSERPVGDQSGPAFRTSFFLHQKNCFRPL